MPRPEVPEGPLSSISEERLLDLIFPVYAPEAADDEWMLVGPGDDTALLRTEDGRTLATTDTMVRGSDWLDEWSTAEQVGAKCVAQNIADIASMPLSPISTVFLTVSSQSSPEPTFIVTVEGLSSITSKPLMRFSKIMPSKPSS